jgi:hypothetical protein
LCLSDAAKGGLGDAAKGGLGDAAKGGLGVLVVKSAPATWDIGVSDVVRQD